MRFSQYLLRTGRTKRKSESESPSYFFSSKAGLIYQTSSGIYTFAPLGQRVIHKITRIVEEEMDKTGALQISMPIMQPADLWLESERWQVYGKEMFKFKNREGRDFCLGPTHEEVVSDFARSNIDSYKDLPITVYQIGRKFRDELRPRHGLLRAKEFLMKDAYSFDTNGLSLDTSYKKMREAYLRIFKRLGLEVICISADPGEIGGSVSEEIIAPSKWGEDRYGLTESGVYAKVDGEEVLEGTERGIEVAHIFKLGTKYSEKMKVTFNGPDGKQQFCQMGCYGIGVSRIISALIDQNHDPDGIIWPESVSPFDVEVIPLGSSSKVMELAQIVYENLSKAGKDVLLDDRDRGVGVKLNDADLIGIPHQVIIGAKSIEEGVVEYRNRKDRKEKRVAPSQIEKILIK